MAFQAFDNKRKSLLGSLTRRRRLIDDLVTAQVAVSQIELNYQRAEVDKIAKAHHEATNEMLTSPENEGEVADRLQTNIDRFADSYDEIQAIFNRFEENLEPTRSENSSSPEVVNNVQRLHPSVNIEQNGNNDRLKEQVDMFADQLYDLMFPVNQEEAQGYPRDQLQVLLNEINQAKTQLNDAFGKLILASSSDEKDEIRERKREIQSNCLRTTALLYKLMEDKANLRVTPSSTSSNVDFSTKLKLPPIEVPKFNGSPEEWIPFRDLYVTMIHENSQLSGSQKFRYLKTCVIDKLSPIKFLAETDAGYEDAWKNIIAFYDNKRKIIDSHFNSLLNAKKMTAENCDELQKLINDYSSNIEALQRLLSKEELFDALTAHLITQRLDVHTRDLLETENDEEVPMWSSVKKSLEKRRKTLSALLPSKIQSRSFQEPLKSKVHHATSSEPFDSKCLLCNENHRLMNCPQFMAMDVSQRFNLAKDKRLCFNCLSKSHGSNKCTSTSRCRTCKQMHHTLLHFNKHGFANQSSNLHPEIEPFVPHVMNKRSRENYATSNTVVSMEAVSKPTTSKNQTLLSTIAVYVYDDEGNMHLCRALLDSGSDSNFITTQCAKKLNLKLEDTCMSLTGINDKTSIIRFKTSTVISSHYGPFETCVELSVMAKITGDLPTQPVDINWFNIPNGHVLADPKFYKASPIDLLLNAEVFFDSLLGEKFRLPEGPMLIHTKFGWIVGGEIKSSTEVRTVRSSSLLSCFSYSNSGDINQSLERFFESEDVSSLKPTWTAEEKYCEEVFKMTTSRDETGRFTTFMPKKWVNKELGKNLSKATRQFHAQEARRQKDQVYNELYTEYMTDFIESGHMSEVKPQDCAYYLPHHGVVNMTSTSTKVRPVFDASSQSETGVALNDVLCVGPTIQPESIDIITRFREKRFVITGDISRMYRQIWIDPSQRKYLSLLWRPKPSEPIKHYQINVVAFGTSCASFVAIRVLQQIAEENVHRFPQASALICKQVYVDDLMFSVDSIEEGVKRRDEILLMLSEAGMQLCKMTANHPDMLHGLPSSAVGSAKNSSMIKALGILYDYQVDEFSYQLKSPNEKVSKLTKATVLAIIASIYDPIGWIGPVLVMAKLFMKKLWLNKLDWKDELPENLKDEWINFHENLPCVNAVKIRRQCLIDNVVAVELHGFCDASINAYGAVIYVRSYNQNGNVQTSILCSKSRVAPKNQKTLARLELCAATLLSKLMSRYAAVLSVSIADVVLWSDSTIVLNWMTMVPSRLQTFVGNRVAMIQDLTNMFKWRHIPGSMNPADVISRGLMPQEMQGCSIWWNGPEFFRFPKSEWPESIITVNEDDPEIAEEMKKVLTTTTVANFFAYIENHRSSANKTRNIFAYILRFVNNVRKERNQRQNGGLTIEEMQNAETFIIKVVQSTSYPQEYKLLQTICDKNEVVQQMPKKSSLIALSPFMDEKGILRVRGRLDASSELTYDQKHQIILPPCNFATGIIRDFHRKYMHPTKSTLKSLIFQKFWIIKAKNTIKRIQHECIKCFRVKPQAVNQLMGNLPKARIKLTTPFVNTAVDYTGFYMIKTSSTRNSSATKAYVVVFKCMCTGAIHLDVASDLSSQAFIAVLDRFVSRRGLCAELFTDNATCFQGANNALKKIVIEMKPAINQYCAEKMIKWNFTTPRSPSAGGIYESGVKLMKHHLKRILDRPYTYEKFYTILCKIEAVLNSRPLIPLSEDPNDFQVLTPGHFLIGRPLTALPEINTIQMKTQLAHWKGLQQVQQKFWQLWYRDYLHLLQTRPSGFREERKFNIGELVLLKDDNLPPMRWMLGRIIQMFPGKDQVVRNVRVKTQHGEHERNVRQICPLPIEESSGQARECVSSIETQEI